ncbi:MAG: hypothetical protein CO066_10800 [Comamonadaceae bacterium CG_4_9_14_0_8_um_filter_60_18]|nr:MAG: hypothetical protein COW39_08985 [Comamonadaceae bacterium CG17_big_fil_post_rev_8_21_14_2_50_60_13]PIY25432.1 MAG: hypothetical protein COZ10_04935 [Comamonadaceae bacterium CG_4_10_14_3_um_filter_60_75]PJC12357.1 MAG: hypothetical protein CO066_10800 [Comamonadaceae bacterium CG_4_9_14_0_8_um_filter_60_18]
MPLRLISALFSTAINASGRADVGFRNTLTAALILPLCFLVGAQWGAVGLAGAWVVGVPAVLLVNFRPISRVLGLRALQVLQAVQVPLLAALVMIAVVFAIRLLLELTVPTWGGLFAQIATGAVAYLGTAFLLDRWIASRCSH